MVEKFGKSWDLLICQVDLVALLSDLHLKDCLAVL